MLNFLFVSSNLTKLLFVVLSGTSSIISAFNNLESSHYNADLYQHDDNAKENNGSHQN